jgi:AcrR family transcriptional regulator
LNAPRVKTRQLKTRMGLLRTAHQLMSKKGVDGTTIQEITDGADVGFGTFYNYFESKDDLATQVLDCVINNLGQRNDLVTQKTHVTDHVLIVATSVRLVAREMMTNPMWHWWVKRPDLLVERMRAGFRPFGIRDMKRAIGSKQYRIIGDDMDTAWSFLIWLLAGGIKDIVDGYRPPAIEATIAESVMRVMGVSRERAAAVSSVELPPYPSLDVDFSFVLGVDAEVAEDGADAPSPRGRAEKAARALVSD